MTPSSSIPTTTVGPRITRNYTIGFGAAVGALLLLATIAYTQLTFFVVQPIGAIPDGVTVVMWRKSAALEFIDSADAVCNRIQGGVSLLCRAVSMGTIAKVNPILIRLPYSEILYDISTGGKSFDR